jgi:hypothetical protein
MSRGDLLLERGAKGLEGLSRKAAAKGGFAAKLADDLAEDAVFLRKLKPSLIKARAKGEAPVAQSFDGEPQAPSAPPLAAPRRKPKSEPKAKKRRRKRGPNPFLVAGVALATGIVLAKVIDWRGHAHPRD